MDPLAPQQGDPRFDCTRSAWAAPTAGVATPGSSAWTAPAFGLPAPGSAAGPNAAPERTSSHAAPIIIAVAAVFLIAAIAYAMGMSSTQDLLVNNTWTRYSDGIDLELDFSSDGTVTYSGSVWIYSVPIADMEYRVIGPGLMLIKRSSSSSWELVRVWESDGELNLSPGITGANDSESWR